MSVHLSSKFPGILVGGRPSPRMVYCAQNAGCQRCQTRQSSIVHGWCWQWNSPEPRRCMESDFSLNRQSFWPAGARLVSTATIYGNNSARILQSTWHYFHCDGCKMLVEKHIFSLSCIIVSFRPLPSLDADPEGCWALAYALTICNNTPVMFSLLEYGKSFIVFTVQFVSSLKNCFHKQHI